MKHPGLLHFRIHLTIQSTENLVTTVGINFYTNSTVTSTLKSAQILKAVNAPQIPKGLP